MENYIKMVDCEYVGVQESIMNSKPMPRNYGFRIGSEDRDDSILFYTDPTRDGNLNKGFSDSASLEGKSSYQGKSPISIGMSYNLPGPSNDHPLERNYEGRSS